MRKSFLLFLCLASLFLLVGCFDKWTEQEKKAFETQCSQIDTFSYVKVHFTGFDSIELSPLIIQEYLGTQLLDDFKLDVPMLKVPNEAVIERILHSKYRYVFNLPSSQVFELANIKATLGCNRAMFSEHCECVMASYTIDGVQSYGEYPTFVKNW
jgi:hypothetical protein